jgi:hypothetical protein
MKPDLGLDGLAGSYLRCGHRWQSGQTPPEDETMSTA